MINYVYLEFWKIDIKYIQFLSENIEELMRLKQTTKKYYNKVFNQF